MGSIKSGESDRHRWGGHLQASHNEEDAHKLTAINRIRDNWMTRCKSADDPTLEWPWIMKRTAGAFLRQMDSLTGQLGRLTWWARLLHHSTQLDGKQRQFAYCQAPIESADVTSSVNCLNRSQWRPLARNSSQNQTTRCPWWMPRTQHSGSGTEHPTKPNRFENQLIINVLPTHERIDCSTANSFTEQVIDRLTETSMKKSELCSFLIPRLCHFVEWNFQVFLFPINYARP